MLFALIGKDKPGQIEVRKANREAHLAYGANSGKVAMAGPLLDDDGQMIGSLILLEVADMAEAQVWAANDPYAQAELFASVELHEWKKVIG